MVITKTGGKFFKVLTGLSNSSPPTPNLGNTTKGNIYLQWVWKVFTMQKLRSEGHRNNTGQRKCSKKVNKISIL